MPPKVYGAIAALVLILHLIWILWVILGAFWTRRRRWLAWLHILSLFWAIIVEISPWPCPLTLAEQFFEANAGTMPYRGSFLVHYLDQLVYPNVSEGLLTWCAVAVCMVNLGIYYRRRHMLFGFRGPG